MSKAKKKEQSKPMETVRDNEAVLRLNKRLTAIGFLRESLK